MYSNIYSNEVLDINNIIHELNELLDNIYNRFFNYKSSKENSMDALVKKYSNDSQFLKSLVTIKNLSDKLADKLELLDSYKYEFYSFLSIKNMICYIIDDIECYLSYSSFASDLISLFNDLIDDKVKCMKNNSGNYDEIFSHFKERLNEFEEFFYLNIYKCTYEYDDLIDEVTNILWCDDV